MRRNAHSPFAFSRCVIGDGHHHHHDDGVSSVAGAGKVPRRSVFCHACCCCGIPLRFQACCCILSICQVPPFAFSSSNRFSGSDNSSFFFFKTSYSEIRCSCSCSAGSPYYPILLSSINCSFFFFFFFKAYSSEVRCSCSTGLLYYPVLLSSIFCGKKFPSSSAKFVQCCCAFVIALVTMFHKFGSSVKSQGEPWLGIEEQPFLFIIWQCLLAFLTCSWWKKRVCKLRGPTETELEKNWWENSRRPAALKRNRCWQKVLPVCCERVKMCNGIIPAPPVCELDSRPWSEKLRSAKKLLSSLVKLAFRVLEWNGKTRI